MFTVNQFEAATKNQILPISASPMQKASNKWIEHGNIEDSKLRLFVKVVHWIGIDELFSSQVWRAAIGEMLGTAVLVFMLDTVTISSFENNKKTPNIVFACLVTLIVAVLRLAISPVSGGQLNPTITVVATLMGLVSFCRAMVYIVAQCIGSVVGSLALKAVVNITIASNFTVGQCTLTTVVPGPNGPTTVGIGTSQGLWLEIVYTFIFLFLVWMSFDHHRSKALGPLLMSSITGIVVGLIMFLSTTVTKEVGYSGAVINPARCIGPAFLMGGHLWTEQWVFWAGPMIACVVFYFYMISIPRKEYETRVCKEHK